MIEISARSAWQKKRKIDINWLKFSPVVFLLFFTSLVAGWELPALIDKKPESEKITVAANAAPITESAEIEPTAGQGPAVGTERIEVTFSSEPAGAVIIIDGENFGVGPITISYGVPEEVSADYNLNVPGGYAVWPDGQKSQVISYFTLSLRSPRSDFVFTSLAPKAGLSYSNDPFSTGPVSGVSADPFNPTLPSMPPPSGLGGLQTSAADQLAVYGKILAGVEAKLKNLRAPRQAPTPIIGVSAAGDELYVQGRRFTADDAQAALEAEATLSGAPVGQLPAGFRAINTDTYAQYMQNIRSAKK